MAVPAIRHWRERPPAPVPPAQPLRSTWIAPGGLDAGAGADYSFGLSLAPDGRQLVYPAAKAGVVSLWLHDLSSGAPNPVRLAKAIQVFVDEAGKETSARRERLRTIVGFAEEFFRGQMRIEVNSDVSGDELLRTSLAKSEKYRYANRPIDSLDACLRALEHIDRNANLGLVIQRWCEEIALRGVAI